MKKNLHLAGVLLALSSATLYGFNNFFVHIAYDNGADPYGLMTGRYVIASAILLAIRFARVGFGDWPKAPVAIRLFLLGAIGLYLNSVCVFNALDRMPSGLAMAIFFFYPMVVVLLGWLLYQHRPDLVVWTCLSTTLLGVVLTVSGVSGSEVSGVIFIVSGAIVYAVYSVLGGKVMPKTDVITGLWFVLTGAAFSFVAVWLLDPPGMPTTFPWTSAVVWSTVEIAVVGTIFGMGLFFAGMNRIGASRSSILQTFEVPVTIVNSLFLLNESMSGGQLVGAALILLGVIGVSWAETRRVDAAQAGNSLGDVITL
ncbi:MAG: DMT family transporter [Ilumatobacteraceae bacterium]